MTTAIRAPFFEIGPKTFLERADLLELVDASTAASNRYDVAVIITPPALDIEVVKDAGPDLWVFAQAMDTAPPGRSTGAILPEALKAVGADGVMLNHAERSLEESVLQHAIDRAHEAELLALVCAEDAEHAARYAAWGADMILLEPHELIGITGNDHRPWIPDVNEAVDRVNPNVLVMHSGGIADEQDVRSVFAQGAAGTGSTTAIIQAADRGDMATRMIAAARQGWSDRASQPVPSSSLEKGN